MPERREKQISKVLEGVWPTDEQIKREKRRFKIWEKKLRAEIKNLLDASGLADEEGLRRTEPVQYIDKDSERSVWLWVKEIDFGWKNPDVKIYVHFGQIAPVDISRDGEEAFRVGGKPGEVVDNLEQSSGVDDLKNYYSTIRVMRELLALAPAKP